MSKGSAFKPVGKKDSKNSKNDKEVSKLKLKNGADKENQVKNNELINK